MPLCNVFSLDSKKEMTFSAKKENVNLFPSSPYATPKKKKKKKKIADVKENTGWRKPKNQSSFPFPAQQ